jgi:hypothetical protein
MSFSHIQYLLIIHGNHALQQKSPTNFYMHSSPHLNYMYSPSSYTHRFHCSELDFICSLLNNTFSVTEDYIISNERALAPCCCSCWWGKTVSLKRGHQHTHVHPPDDIWVWDPSGMMTGQDWRNLRKIVPFPPCSPQTPCGLTQAITMTGLWLTTWAIARSSIILHKTNPKWTATDFQISTMWNQLVAHWTQPT